MMIECMVRALVQVPEETAFRSPESHDRDVVANDRRAVGGVSGDSNVIDGIVSHRQHRNAGEIATAIPGNLSQSRRRSG
jgi:hypothetical protein